jgi:predicted nucleic acid-binding protein
MPWSTNREARAVLDTCVLAPMPLCDTLLRCAEEPALYRPGWSEETLREIHRTMRKFGHSGEKADRRIASMRSVFPGATIHLLREVIEKTPELPDAKDRHVLAAAIKCEAEVIVTLNLRHFPSGVLDRFGIAAQSPDTFLSDLFHLGSQQVLKVLDEQARAVREEMSGLLRRLHQVTPNFVELVRGAS